MTSEDLYEDYDEEGQARPGGKPEQPETITVPVEEISGSVSPGAMLEVVSVDDGIATFRVVPREETSEETEAKATV